MSPRLRPRMTASARAKAAVALATAFILTGCSTATDGTPTASSNLGTSTTAAATATTTTTTAADPLDHAPAQYRTMLADTNRVMAKAAAWWTALGAVGMPTTVIWDASVPCPKKGDSTPAWTCKNPPTVAVNPPTLDRTIYTPAGFPGLTLLIGHEASHPGMRLVDPTQDTDDSTEERRADCFAGAFQQSLIADGTLTAAQAEASAQTLFEGKSSRTKAWRAGFSGGGSSACWTYRP
ncbi:hypothetical protein [Mycobacteroides abscessus]|uniref:hypothetical protein n=1 Tax=Mycobacteroides abscessus TaxID=36809 RepID=UPI00092BE9CE|nr:hypothetical protein [Mycobacteroides abscessus]SHX65313.1 Predicted metalloprotease [Mycobacteroides abscessus subsp. abscessus]SHZ17607.1 Predicted metalloprotease [Mycobacteroides abscessus subsp. abscessus]SIB51420.1 Predicted metalloprotease [Mycobacteroides abscessus subsp. abscessus]SIF17893.1 Predicted metalloprotease [Mycobacteroides abscessus subsp. abscessus]SKI47981.1 Predicted metalloprotease [Mycobacteroides abscessus subsp. abscessus]